MPPFLFNVAFKRQGEKWRRFPQETQPDVPGSWSELKSMILTACMRVFLDPQHKGPLRYRVEGKVPLRTFRRSPFAPKPRPIDVMRLIVELNPLNRMVKVRQYVFAEQYRGIQDDLEDELGKPHRWLPIHLPDPVPQWFKSGLFDPTKVHRMPEPMRDEYAITKPALVTRPVNLYELPKVERYRFPGR